MSIVKDGIVATGEAPAGWINRARAAAQQLSVGGVDFNISKVRDVSLGELKGLKDAIESTYILFDTGKAVPDSEQMAVVDKLADDIKQLTTNAQKAGVTAHFMLTGHTDTTGRETANLSLSVARAETVLALLYKRGVNPELLSVRGAGTFEPAVRENAQTGNSANRRVSIAVSFQ